MRTKLIALVLAQLLAATAGPVGPIPPTAPPDEPSDMLARAEALYYEADFEKSVELLLRADELLKQRKDSVKEKTDVKLQLALDFIGLNDSARAKTYLGELFALDADRKVDPQMYSPKVIKLAEEAKADQEAQRCQSLVSEAQKELGTGNSAAVVKLISSNKAKCSGLDTLNPKVADLVFKEGLDAYKKTQMPEALGKFRTALALKPDHELAAQYVDLTESKLEFTSERALSNWRKNFNAADYPQAALDYRELTTVANAQTLTEIRSEYRRMLSNLVEAWNRACASNDRLQMETVRVRINALLPEPSIGDDILGGMKTCAPAGCLVMESALALARLKTRVEPIISAQVAAQIRVYPVTVRVKTKINEKGEVVTAEPQGGNAVLYPAIRTAIEQWKFLPAIIEGVGARCVDTEIQFVVNLNTK